MKVKEKYSYNTSITHVEYDGVEYIVKCQQDIDDENIWEIGYINDEYFDPIEIDMCSELADKLIEFVTKTNK
jgi:hypothetical protein